ncbi:chromo domain containing protein [Grosmannia clavigera kw1407]|uniref:Chromo domain containing protein n=1 Tax=Grosmannia clavigera (strain kw1407 / UAMH 11150) TaxID=655863 RepID=F0X6J0_GROCL|nr:chromo domain containing protein [Grosmannia clavigera kw1407]EFX06573.1 chromo domain containing protein [Grosmannia clavigera kw1407]
MATASMQEDRLEAISISDDDDDDDNISLTSTVDENLAYDTEYLVKDILAESETSTGGRSYLVEWADYELQHCTWEPEDQIGAEIVDEFWHKQRGLPDYKPFDIERYNEAVRRWTVRHNRRNQKRRRLGLPMTKLDNPSLVEEQEPFDTAEESDTHEEASTSPARIAGETETPELRKRTKNKPDAAATKSTPAVQTAAQAKKPDRATDGAKQTATSQVRNVDRAHKKPSDLVEGPSGLTARRKMTESAATKTATAVSPTIGRTAGKAGRAGTTPGLLAKARTSTAKSVASGPTERASFSARKSGAASRAAVVGNAFIDGKRVRKMTTLETAVTDSSRNSMLFNRRVRRIAELRERSRPDGAIEAGVLSTKLFPITQGPVLSRQQQRKQKQTEATATAVSENGPEDKAHDDGEALQKAKKRRTVRFIVSDSSDSDSNDGGGWDTPAEEDVSFGDHHSPTHGADLTRQPGSPMHPVPTHSVESTLLLGPRKKPISVYISGVVLPVAISGIRFIELPLAEILGNEPLHFEHIVLAESLVKRLQQMHQGMVFHGNVAATAAAAREEKEDESSGGSSTAALETAAERLRTMASGLFLSRPGTGMLLYPAQSEDWRDELFGFPLLANTANAPLRCVAFRMPIDFGPYLRKPSLPADAGSPNVDPVLDVPEGMSNREYLMQTFFQLDRASYLPLFPQYAQQAQGGVGRSVFFIFPPSLLLSMYQMAGWVRVVDSASKIYLCSRPGAWLAFQEAVTGKKKGTEKEKNETEAGVVVIHELATWSVRRFFGICNLAEGESCRIWSLSQSMILPALFPSDGQTDFEEGRLTRQPGQVCWTQLFPHGMAILVTPSFLVAEPQRAYDLFEWFFRVRRLAPGIAFQLVTTCDFCRFLEVLAREKARQREMILASRQAASLRLREERAAQLGLTHDVCECRFRTWLLVREALRQYERPEGWVFRRQDDGPIVQMPAAVDGNDEQSLVNYYAEWATRRLDRFRAFYVVGSDQAGEGSIDSVKRRIPIPTFAADTKIDPDSAWGVPEEEGPLQAAEAAAQQSPKPSVDPKLPSATSVVQGLTSYLMQCNSGPEFWRFYGFPVLWMDGAESVAFPMHGYKCSISDWFSYSWSFLTRIHNFRSYVGLFFTPDHEDAGEGQKQEHPARREYGRHAWVAVYRPEHAHKRPFRTTEIIIWDLRAATRLAGMTELREEDLTAAQQKLIGYVRQQGPDKNPGLDLVSVWIGSQLFDLEKGAGKEGEPRPQKQARFVQPAADDSELHVTMQYLDSLVRSFKDVLPATANYLQERGYRPVRMRRETRGADGSNETKATAKTKPKKRTESFDESDEGGEAIDDGGPAGDRVVIHPPRGHSQQKQQQQQEQQRPVRRSRCSNALFEAVQRIRRFDAQATTMSFVFRPTTEWYGEQMEEGRGFEHLHVVGSQAFFRSFGGKGH